ncbi:hypothetical protein MCOR25_007213 [Pyricularia grisea]|nr:hypothetical protein MCOR25_007213 [Pyricularia grisea]
MLLPEITSSQDLLQTLGWRLSGHWCLPLSQRQLDAHSQGLPNSRITPVFCICVALDIESGPAYPGAPLRVTITSARLEYQSARANGLACKKNLRFIAFAEP